VSAVNTGGGGGHGTSSGINLQQVRGRDNLLGGGEGMCGWGWGEEGMWGVGRPGGGQVY